MFWQSVISGIGAFFDWSIILGVFGISVAFFAHFLTVTLIIGDGESGGRVGAGLILMMIGGPIVQILSVSLFFLLCLPAVIGNGGFTPLEFVGSLAWPVLKFGLIAGGAIVLASLAPMIGSFIAKIPGMPIFLQGVLMLQLLARSPHAISLEGQMLAPGVFPSFLECIGYLFISWIICLIPLITVRAAIELAKRMVAPIQHAIDQNEWQPNIIAMMIGPLIGIMPLLMYGQHISLSLWSE